MEFLPLSRRPSSSRNVPSGEERWETGVFAGLVVVYTTFKWINNLKEKGQPLSINLTKSTEPNYTLLYAKHSDLSKWNTFCPKRASWGHLRSRDVLPRYLRKKNAGKSSLTYVQAPRPPPHFYILCSHVSGIVSANGSEAKEPQESGCSKRTTIFPS